MRAIELGEAGVEGLEHVVTHRCEIVDAIAKHLCRRIACNSKHFIKSIVSMLLELCNGIIFINAAR